MGRIPRRASEQQAESDSADVVVLFVACAGRKQPATASGVTA